MNGENAAGYPTSYSGQTGETGGAGNRMVDLEYAASSSGAREYLDDIYTNALSKAKDACFAYDNVLLKLRDGWIGVAEKSFESELFNGAQAVADKLDEAKASIETEVNSVITTMKEQDEKYADETLKFEIK